jgi:hypothetical protein
MTDQRFMQLRILRAVIWTILMCVTSAIVGWYNPGKVVFVPCVFMALIVPMILLPMKNRPGKDS